MIPQLSTGAINQILNGENVPNPVLQLLKCKKVPGNDHYCFLISDGATSFPFAVLGLHLNHMVANKQLICHTIVQVDEYKWHSEENVINLLKLTVLVPGHEVKKQIENPVNSFFGATSTGAATNASAEKGVAETCDSKINTVCHQDSSMAKMMQMMFPELTNGAINQILNGESVANAVIQILGYEKIDCVGKNRYSLLISDGVDGYPFAILGKKLDHLVINKELEEFAIVQVQKCACKKIATRHVIILLRLTVVVPGNEVNEKLGNPVIPTDDAEKVMLNLKAYIINLKLKSKEKEKIGLLEKTRRLTLEKSQFIGNRRPENEPQADSPTVGNIQSSNNISVPTGNKAEPLAFLWTQPQFQQMRQMIQQNPQSLNAILQQIGQNNPQLLVLISQNQEEFVRMLHDPSPGGGQSGRSAARGSTPPATPAGNIPNVPLESTLDEAADQVSPQDREAIERGMHRPENEPQADSPTVGNIRSINNISVPTGNEAEPLAFLWTQPQFQQMRQMIQLNPQSLNAILQQIGQNNPQLLVLIAQNQEEFVRMLNDPSPGSGQSGTPVSERSAASSGTAPSTPAGNIPNVPLESTLGEAQISPQDREATEQTSHQNSELKNLQKKKNSSKKK